VGPNVIRFSPDGRSILLWVTGAEPVVWLLPAREGTAERPRRLFEGHVSSIVTGASWLPDSRRIVISLKDALWLGDTVDGSLVKLMGGTRAAFFPSVSPDGTRVLFTEQVENYDVIELSLEGGPPRVLVGTSQYDGSGVWAPKGGRLAYATRRAGAEAVWTRTGEEMSDQKLLGPADVPGSLTEFFKGLSFSPDGAWLSVLCARASPTLESRVWIAPARGGAPRPITPEGTLALSASWAPDGASLAVNMVRNGRLTLWIASPDGGSKPRLVPLPADTEVRSAEWSPTGEWIAAIKYVPGTEPRPTLLIRPDGSETRVLPSLDSPALVWAADGRTLYGVSNRSGTSELMALDVAAATVRTVANYGARLDLADNLGGMLRFTLGPERRSFVTTVHADTSDVWMLSGLR
jgi:Tol biopolymer transport system component